jgi:hypothetical protein
MGVLVHDVYNSTKPDMCVLLAFHVYRITIYMEKLPVSLLSVGLVRTNHVRDAGQPDVAHLVLPFVLALTISVQSIGGQTSEEIEKGAEANMEFAGGQSGVERLKKKRNCAEQLLRSLSVNITSLHRSL